MPESLTFSGRTFGAGELELMRQTAQEFSALGVTEIARTVCELLEWTRPNGGLKNHECRQLLEQLQTEGFLKLPAVRKLGGRGPRRADLSELCCEPVPVHCAAGECEPLELALVESQAESRRWREQVERYHYLGCRVPFGAHLRYWVRNRERELACLLLTSPAWKMQARDEWIGWNGEQRQRNLQWIVSNARFLILPLVRVQGLASKILALSARRLPLDWERHYGYVPCCWKLWWMQPVFAEPAIAPPTGFMLGKPPDVVAWTGRTPLTVKQSKISMFIRWRATCASSYAGINIEESSLCRRKRAWFHRKSISSRSLCSARAHRSGAGFWCPRT